MMQDLPCVDSMCMRGAVTEFDKDSYFLVYNHLLYLFQVDIYYKYNSIFISIHLLWW